MRAMSFLLSAGEKSCSKSPSVEPLVGVYAASDCIAASVFSMSWGMVAKRCVSKSWKWKQKREGRSIHLTIPLTTVPYCLYCQCPDIICLSSFPLHHAKSHGWQPLTRLRVKFRHRASGTKQFVRRSEDTEALFFQIGFAAPFSLPCCIAFSCRQEVPRTEHQKETRDIQDFCVEMHQPMRCPEKGAHGSVCGSAPKIIHVYRVDICGEMMPSWGTWHAQC